MTSDSIWITGPTRSGKTTRLVELFGRWVEERQQSFKGKRRHSRQSAPTILVFAANDDNRRDLADRLATAIQGQYPVFSKTPLGFFQDEVMLFWPLLIQRLNLRAQFPLRLRPETEQELATRLWREDLERGILRSSGLVEYRLVRHILDLFQLAAVSGTAIEEIPSILAQGYPRDEVERGTEEDGEQGEVFDLPQKNVKFSDPASFTEIGRLLLEWRNWCLQRGLLTYSIISELYWQYLLPDLSYQQHLRHRYQRVLADDVDDYPAIARSLFDLLLDGGAVGAFTYNPDGAIRLGLNADPQHLEGLKGRCQIETLTWRSIICLDDVLGEDIVQAVADPTYLSQLPDSVRSLSTISRAQLLRQTCEAIGEAVRLGEVQPEEVAVIAPGLDAIARYTIIEILTHKGIPVESLNDQRPLNTESAIRALLTLLALVYPGLGRLVDRDAVAEMLVVLSNGASGIGEKSHPELTAEGIDPVRAGLLADYCYSPDPEQPRLLPVTEFSRWDRLGHQATTAYEEIVKWLEGQRSQQQDRLTPSCVAVLDRAMQKFFLKSNNLPFDQLAALRELMETAQHYWEVDARMRQLPLDSLDQMEVAPAHTTVGRLIQLLRSGTVTANPYPVRPLGAASRAVTLATIFQYRAARRHHRWQFWLDAGSPLWLKGGAATLFGANLFLKDWPGTPWTEEHIINADEQRLRRILRDLLGRAGERVYLCHSDLATNGQEQNGPLLSLVNAAVPVSSEALV